MNLAKKNAEGKKRCSLENTFQALQLEHVQKVGKEIEDSSIKDKSSMSSNLSEKMGRVTVALKEAPSKLKGVFFKRIGKAVKIYNNKKLSYPGFIIMSYNSFEDGSSIEYNIEDSTFTFRSNNLGTHKVCSFSLNDEENKQFKDDMILFRKEFFEAIEEEEILEAIEGKAGEKNTEQVVAIEIEENGNRVEVMGNC